MGRLGGSGPELALGVVLAIESDLQRYGMEQVLSLVPEVSGVRSMRPFEEALTSVRDSAREVVVVSVETLSARTAVGLVKAQCHGVRVIVLFDEDVVPVEQVITLPAAGFLSARDLRPREIASALGKVSRGELAFPDALGHRLLAVAREATGGNRLLPRITPREQEALTLLVEGLTNKQIARRLCISDHGAKRLVANLMAKLDCPNRTLVVARVLRDGLPTGL